MNYALIFFLMHCTAAVIPDPPLQAPAPVTRTAAFWEAVHNKRRRRR